MRVTLPAIASSSKHKTAIASVDVDDYNDAGESRVSSSKDVATLKLDPKAGFQIFVSIHPQLPGSSGLSQQVRETDISRSNSQTVINFQCT